MNYADSKCTMKEETNPHRYVYSGPCFLCKTKVEVTIPGEELFAYRHGELIQKAMPSVPLTDREFLISGTCPTCWEDMWSED